MYKCWLNLLWRCHAKVFVLADVQIAIRVRPGLSLIWKAYVTQSFMERNRAIRNLRQTHLALEANILLSCRQGGITILYSSEFSIAYYLSFNLTKSLAVTDISVNGKTLQLFSLHIPLLSHLVIWVFLTIHFQFTAERTVFLYKIFKISGFAFPRIICQLGITIPHIGVPHFPK